MMSSRLVRLAAGAAALLSGLAAHAAFEPFVVRNFRVEGAQRIAEGTIYNYLPVNIGDTINDQRQREAFRALFDTGFFQDMEFRRDGDTLVIVVLERPTIEEFTFEGNKDIKDEDLENSMTNVGLATGKTFNPSVLDEVKQVLTEEYYGGGRYGAVVPPNVEDLPDNRVRVPIDIVEASAPRFARSTSSATRSSRTASSSTSSS